MIKSKIGHIDYINDNIKDNINDNINDYIDDNINKQTHGELKYYKKKTFIIIAKEKLKEQK